MPVTGSSFVFRWAIVHDGVIRRSDEEAVEVIKSGMSRVVAMTDVRQDRRDWPGSLAAVQGYIVF